ncbi:MAG: hypothetical protein SH856_05925 [Flavobacteriales bacterium]|nr:hypothetical protein [Flavobacteriales bacterium]
MAHVTLDDLREFTQNEQQMIEEVLHTNECNEMQPSQQTLDRIIGYARALSVRKSERLHHFSMVLN